MNNHHLIAIPNFNNRNVLASPALIGHWFVIGQRLAIDGVIGVVVAGEAGGIQIANCIKLRPTRLAPTIQGESMGCQWGESMGCQWFVTRKGLSADSGSGLSGRGTD